MTLADALAAFGVRRVEDRAVRVATVDSGIHGAHPHVHGVAGGVSLLAGSDPGDYVDRNGHGTAVAAAIREKAPGAELFAVKIFDRTLAADAEDLARGIEWAAAHAVDLINLSVGTSNAAHADRLRAALHAARAAGATVIAAAEQSGAPSLPGSLPGVVSVRVDWACEREVVSVEACGPDRLRLGASGYPRPIPGVPRERNLRGVSFAVANATGIIARLLTSTL